MKNLNKEMLISLGGKLWEKNGMERVYLSIEVVKELTGVEDSMGFNCLREPSDKAKKAKTFFNVNTGELTSDVGVIRTEFRRNGFNCSK